MSLADQLRKAVRDSGLSMYRISADTGMNGPTLVRFMSGERDLTLGRADVLARYFKMRLTPPQFRD